ncbi:MAG: RNA polymerase sigma factor region1.1 domain-containing protein, partial [Moraxellaceae bacterium]|nr:RNA polymerase sigma factor region1.1 domain-containing protein [Moraxellaceae bacterium]
MSNKPHDTSIEDPSDDQGNEPISKEHRNSLLATLIARGKEQGFLTFGDVNDHLPESVTESEQIDDIIQMLNDLGIPVHERAPEADEMMREETPEASDDDLAAEEAAAVLASVENEPGRTTDPVRMYMREMGTVELLTREGEIAIAKRIEDGIRDVLNAMAYWPGAVDLLINEFDAVEAGERRLADVLVGFLDPDDDGASVPAVVDDEAAIAVTTKAKDDSNDDDEDDADGDGDDDEADTGLDIELVRTRINDLRAQYQLVDAAKATQGMHSKVWQKHMVVMAEQFMIFKLTPRIYDAIADHIRSTVSNVRAQERTIMIGCVRRAGMDRA